MRSVKIKKISSLEVDTKYGKKKKLNLQVIGAKGEQFVDGFANQITETWKEGDVVDIDITPREWNGKTYYGFKAPKIEEIILRELSEIKEMLKGLGKKEIPNPDDF